MLDIVTQRSLGNGALCAWSTDRSLTMFLGSAASVAASSTLMLKTNSLQLAGRSVMNTSVPVLPPLAAVSPLVLVALPAVASPCEAAVLDAGLSQGSGGRQFIVEWSLVAVFNSQSLLASPPDTSKVQAALDAASAIASLRVSIPAGLLSSGWTYAFALKLTNFMGRTGSTGTGDSKLELSVGLLDSPSLELPGGSQQAVRVDATVSLAARAAFSKCSLAPTTKLAFSWRQVAGPSTVQLSSTQDSRKVLVLPGQLLFGQGTYSFQVSVALASKPDTPLALATTVVSILEASLVPVIAGGSRSVSASEVVLLDASGSVDINTAPLPQRPGTTHTLTYTWQCAVLDDPVRSCSSLQPVQGNTSSKLELQPGDLMQFGGRVLQWTVLVTSALVQANSAATIQSRSGSASVQLRLSSVPVLQLGVPMPDGALLVSLPDGRSAWRVEGSSSILLNASVTLPPGDTLSSILYSWVQVEGDLDMQRAASRRLQNTPGSSPALSTPSNQAAIVIRSGRITPGRVYTLRVTAAHVMAPAVQGSSTVVLLANAPPSAGSFTATPLQPGPIIALTSTLSLAAFGWQDDQADLPLKFSFWADATGITPSDAQLAARAAGRPLDATELSSSVQVKLPSPRVVHESGFGNITLIAYASDRQGASTFSRLTLSVRRPVALQPASVREFIRGQLNSTQETLLTGDSAGVLSQLAGLADLLADGDPMSANSSASDIAQAQNLTGMLLQQALNAVGGVDFDDSAVALASNSAAALTRRPASLGASGRSAAISIILKAIGPSSNVESNATSDNSSETAQGDSSGTDNRHPKLSARAAVSVLQVGVNLLDSVTGDVRRSQGDSSSRQLSEQPLEGCSVQYDELAKSVQDLMTAAALSSVRGAAPNQEPVQASSGSPSTFGHTINMTAAALPADRVEFSTDDGTIVQVPSGRDSSETAALLLSNFGRLYCDTSTKASSLMSDDKMANATGVSLSELSSGGAGLETTQLGVDLAVAGQLVPVKDRAAGSGVVLQLPLVTAAPLELGTLPFAVSYTHGGSGLPTIQSLQQRFEFECPSDNSTNSSYTATGLVQFPSPCPGLDGEYVTCSSAEAGATIAVTCAAEAVTAGCLFFDESRLAFSSEGCVLLKATELFIQCECSHLTTFAGRFGKLSASNQRTVTQGSSQLADLGKQAGQINSADDAIRLAAENEPFVVVFVWLLFVAYAVLLCITCNMDARQQKAFLRHLSLDEEVLFLKHVSRLAGVDFRLVEHLTVPEEAAVVRDPMTRALPQAANNPPLLPPHSGEPLLLNMMCPLSRAWFSQKGSKCADAVLCSVHCCTRQDAREDTAPESTQPEKHLKAPSQNTSTMVAASPKQQHPAAAMPLPTATATPSHSVAAVPAKHLTAATMHLRLAQIYRGISMSGLTVGSSTLEKHIELHPHFRGPTQVGTLTAKREAIDAEAATQPALPRGLFASSRKVGEIVCSAVLLRIKYQHKYWGVCTKFDFSMSRAKRLTMLYMSIMIAMAAAAVFYDVRHPTDEDELAFGEVVVFSLLACAIQLPLSFALAQLLFWAAGAEFKNTYQDLDMEIQQRRNLEAEMKRAQRDARVSQLGFTEVDADATVPGGAAAAGVRLDFSSASKWDPCVGSTSLDSFVQVDQRLRWEVVCCRSGRSSCAVSKLCADAPAAAFTDPEHPNGSDVDSEDDEQYGWTDAPPFCMVSCPALLRCCGRHPSQRAPWLRRAREADFEPYGCCWIGGVDEPASPRVAVSTVWQRRTNAPLSTAGAESAARAQVRMVARGYEFATTRQNTQSSVQGVAGDALTLFLQSVSLTCACRRRYIVGLHQAASAAEQEALSEQWAIVSAAQARVEAEQAAEEPDMALGMPPKPVAGGHALRETSVSQRKLFIWSSSVCQRRCPDACARACLRGHCCCIRSFARGQPVSALRGWEGVIAWAIVLVVFVLLLTYVLLFGLSRGSDTLRAFLLTFFFTQVVAVLLVEPFLITAGIIWALVLFPALSASLSWVPCLGSILSPPGGIGGPEAATLSGRLEHVSLVQAAGAASGLPADSALLAFSVVSSLASAMFGGLGRWRRGVTARAVATGERAQAAGDAELAEAYLAWQSSAHGLPSIATSEPMLEDEESGSTPRASSEEADKRALARASGRVDYHSLATAQVARMVFSGRVPPPSSASALRRQVQLVSRYLAQRCPPAVIAIMAQRYADATGGAPTDDMHRAMVYFLGEQVTTGPASAAGVAGTADDGGSTADDGGSTADDDGSTADDGGSTADDGSSTGAVCSPMCGYVKD